MDEIRATLHQAFYHDPKMSSGFVPSRTVDADPSTDASAASAKSDIEWRLARKEIETAAVRKAEMRARDAHAPRPSLFETLEANKIAKQEAFEESHRLRNQFRALQQDEVDFLDSVLERTRAEEARIKKETLHGLQSFRQQQEAANQKANSTDILGVSMESESEPWKFNTRKRKRATDKKDGLTGKKNRKSQPTNEVATNIVSVSLSKAEPQVSPDVEVKATLEADSQVPTLVPTGESGLKGRLVEYDEIDD